MVCHEFSHSRGIEATLNHAEGSVYTTVARNNGVMVGRNDFLDAVLRYDNLIVSPHSSVFEVLTLVVFEFTGGRVEDVRE